VPSIIIVVLPIIIVVLPIIVGGFARHRRPFSASSSLT